MLPSAKGTPRIILWKRVWSGQPLGVSLNSWSSQRAEKLAQFSCLLQTLSTSCPVLPSITVSPRSARVRPAVHPAPFPAVHRWGLARRALAGHGQAARGQLQLWRLFGIVRQLFHFPLPLNLLCQQLSPEHRDSGIFLNDLALAGALRGPPGVNMSVYNHSMLSKSLTGGSDSFQNGN